MLPILRALIWMLLAGLAAACATTTATVAPTSMTALPTPTAEQVESSDADRPYAPSDVSLVANTGRPQFLDSYADW